MAANYASAALVADEEFNDRQRLFEDFLASDRVYGERQYKELIKEMLKKEASRLIVNLNDLREFNSEAVQGLLYNPLAWIPPLQAAISEIVGTVNEWGIERSGEYQVGFQGSFGALHTTPRHLASNLLSKMVCVDGIVTSCSLVRPKLLKSVHYAEERRAFLMREYWDSTMLNGKGASTASTPTASYPTTAPGGTGEQLRSEFGLSTFRDYQTVSMQEMPEKAPAGQLPRSIDVVLDEDLVDAVKPGDRVQIVGVYKSLNAGGGGGFVPNSFRVALIALNVRLIGGGNASVSAAGDVEGDSPLNEDDLENIKAIGKRRNVFDLLAASVAPSIYGHANIKKAVLLMLLGGVEKNLSNGTHLRGDINLMLVGDPSTAKSQMLRFVLSLAPLAIATTGRGSSGVGLTAAVTHDRETGERRLEAGAMVLADRGIVCIDEFDKMSDQDRVAIHEVMEQQTVTIAKAGIHASLNARCSVLAAANPIWGQYRESASPQENIRLPDSLLSRFDLLFIVLDKCGAEVDRRIAEHVLRMHRYVPAGAGAEGVPLNESMCERNFGGDSDDEDGADDPATTSTARHQVFQPNLQKHTINDEGEEGASQFDEILTISFLKKYIWHAHNNIKPTLSPSATEYITAAYAEFRQQREDERETKKTFPVTPRTIETLIRLASAHAKARLSPDVERQDAQVAVELLESCLYKEVLKAKKKSKKSKKPASSLDDDADDGGAGTGTSSKNTNDAASYEMEAMNIAADNGQFAGMHGLSLEEVETSTANETKDYSIAPSLQSTQSQSQQQQQKHQQDSASLEGPWVDVSQLSAVNNNSNSSNDNDNIIAAATLPSSSSQNNNASLSTLASVKGALHKLRSKSSNAVFTCTIPELMAALSQSDDASGNDGNAVDDKAAVMEALYEMMNMNQIMLSDGTIYII